MNFIENNLVGTDDEKLYNKSAEVYLDAPQRFMRSYCEEFKKQHN